MGDKSETFCRQTLALLAANPQMVPPNLGAKAQADLVALDALRPRLIQLRQLLERGDDTEIRWAATSSVSRWRATPCSRCRGRAKR